MSEQQIGETQAGRLIIATVGASVLNRDKLERLSLFANWDDLRMTLPRPAVNQHREWITQILPPNMVGFRNAYINALSGLTIDEEKNRPGRGGTNAFSAELTGLYLMNLDADRDHIVFLLSDSPEGVIAGLLVKEALQEIFSMTPELQIVNGLQVENFLEFFGGGLEEFANFVIGCIKRFPQHTPVLNVTGGFKSLIPYAAYIALGQDVALYFSFEEQPDPIVIDPKRLPEQIREKLQPFQEDLRREPLLMRHSRVEE